ncbi:MAG: hypothetical protein M1816_007071 [Peltula sp. TS41687]|nr:MAG: hypothetical protein M1816_007071 [Peltula sp. TS41687]
MPRRVPTDDVLATALVGVVRDWFEEDAVDRITVNRVRAEVEFQCKLPSGYLKDHDMWNGRSKAIIHDEFQVLTKEQEEDDEVESQSPVPSKKSAKASTPKSQSKPNRRKRKRAESEVVEDESMDEPTENNSSANESSMVKESEDDADDAESGPTSEEESTARNEPRKKRDRPEAKGVTSDTEDTEVDDRSDDDASNVKSQEVGVNGDEPKESLSDSEMSVLIDKEPPPKRGRRKPSSSESKSKSKRPVKKSKTAKANDNSSPDPQEAEIKRLQQNLRKCGIQKPWHKELARFDTPRAKINHLKDMLKGIGMVGRFSQEKARQIKEERELQAEVQAVQDSAKRWGETQTDEDEDGDEDTGGKQRPQRRMAKGLEDIGFLGDDDGVETD